jgi:hypothetical protein
MIDLGRVLRQVNDIWNNPPYTELSDDTFLDCANRRITQRMLDLNLTPGAGMMLKKSPPFTFSGSVRDMSGLMPDGLRILRLEFRASGSTSDLDWQSVAVMNEEDWPDALERGDKDCCAFYGTPPNLKLELAFEPGDSAFRAVYQVAGAQIDDLTASAVDLPNYFEPVLVYDIALECGELIDNQSDEFAKKKSTKMPYLARMLQDSLTRFDHWRMSQGGRKGSRRPFNDRGGSNFGNRKFRVNF